MDKNFFINYLGICLASTTAETVTFPIDSIKTRMQINNKHGFGFHMKNHGVGTLYRGLKPAVCRHFIYKGIKINFYDHLRNKAHDYNYTKTDIMPKMFGGAVAGMAGQLVANPADVLKIQMINGDSSMTQIAQKVFKDHGIRGFYKGWSPNVLRAGAVNMGELATYDTVKQIILVYRPKEDNITFTISSFSSGLVSSVCSTPFDSTKSKMMANIDKYSGVYDCMYRTIQQHGVRELYKGVWANWLRLAPWQFIFWNTYEGYRKLVGLEGF
tara:strand:+ start:378 stop:1187 length:810 start_codon:yes stop_codon:yes gene_type:complete